MENYGFFGRLAYKTSFGLSYGVVYPVRLVTRMVPKDNALVHGLSDGALAARDEASVVGRKSAAELSHQEGSMAAHPA